ncbi:MAG: hypothetical protein LBL66_11260 [Clostridiales bacterium]|jgi:hypothetical protein|nr:hypothetical protein [Clostridiales bacterium]
MKNMKKKICLILAVFCSAAFMPSCANGGGDGGNSGNAESDFKKYEFTEIAYEASAYDAGERGRDVTLIAPGKRYAPGEDVSVSVKLAPAKTLPTGKDAYYAVVDWGDGAWSYIGPGRHGADGQSSLTASHAYKRAGEYGVGAGAFSMQTEQVFAWSEVKTVTVEGETVGYGGIIDRVKPVSSATYGKEFSAENITDGKPSYFKSKAAEDVDDEQYAGYLFDHTYALSKVEIKIPTAADIFPSNIAVEYTTDGGESWHSLPKYYYLYDYSKGRFTPVMGFPNPKGATLVLPLDGITANGLRVTSKLTSVKLSDLTREKVLCVEEMRVYGSPRTLFYTSLGEQYDAELNNMWTIFGTAKTEPIVFGSIDGAQTNSSPFRSGFAMIASNEWLEWSGLKFNFTDYAEVRNVYFNQLKNVRVGADGWSNDSGYVWATNDAPDHLDLGNHYSLNPIFIIAARNYLLMGNEAGEFDDEENFTPFLDLLNRQDQTMRYRLDKAMSYMMNTLEGGNGLLTILDPKHDGTSAGFSANYWDTHRGFGYKSAYENALFYASLLAYADIAEFDGDAEKAAEYRACAARTKTLYNAMFWDSEKGRFIMAVNVNGVRVDFGATFVNFYAAAYGVADTDKAAKIYEWLDGKRIVEGDTSTGDDIYGQFKYAARANTLDVSSTGAPYFWYDHGGALPCTPDTFGGYGNQMQNGGTIFYISHYDLLGRIKNIGADDAFARFSVITDEFRKDELRRNSYTRFGEYVEGVMGEFPESGLVPYTFVNGFLGINASPKGLRIEPSLPSSMQFAGITKYMFGNREYSIRVEKGLAAPKVEIYGDLYYVQLPAEKSYTITLDNRLIENAAE